MKPNGKSSEQRWLNILSENILLNIAAAAALRRASSSNPGWFTQIDCVRGKKLSFHARNKEICRIQFITVREHGGFRW